MVEHTFVHVMLYWLWSSVLISEKDQTPEQLSTAACVSGVLMFKFI